MAHFAKVLDGKVIDVIVAEPEYFETFVDSSPGEWIQASYNTYGGVHHDPVTGLPDGGVALRKNYPSKGFTYDYKLDAFISPKPYPSWLLNEETGLWEAPIPLTPQEGVRFRWDEDAGNWVPTQD